MAININQPEIDMMLNELIKYTGETAQQAIMNSVKERLGREKAKTKPQLELSEELLQIGRECAALPILDNRRPDEMLGYNQSGLPT